MKHERKERKRYSKHGLIFLELMRKYVLGFPCSTYIFLEEIEKKPSQHYILKIVLFSS